MKLILTVFIFGITSTWGYFWRDYNFSTIPKDALVAGKDTNGKNIYIGQAYLKNVGILPAQINEGIPHVYVTFKGVHKIEEHIKILCDSPDNNYWLNTSSSAFYGDTDDKNLILGGHEDVLGNLNIGRYSGGTEQRIGKIVFYSTGPRFLYFDGYKEVEASRYSVLVNKLN